MTSCCSDFSCPACVAFLATPQGKAIAARVRRETVKRLAEAQRKIDPTSGPNRHERRAHTARVEAARRARIKAGA